ncbi:MAG TPA: hypothetical protein VHO25_16800 [Polyangiaceae bacterium]|nr:hypothetical protein [Polyangiaceae bacterium]
MATKPRTPLLLLTSRSALLTLERRGFDLGSLLFGASNARSAQDLSTFTAYRDLTASIGRDLARARTRDPALGEGMRFGHRAFPSSWLSSPAFHFELAAVVNRMDRKVFAPNTCGELRFIYRLGYRVSVEGTAVQSRLPMTINVVTWLPGPDCNSWLRRLETVAGDTSLDSFSPALLTALQLKSVEIDLQSARWPSTVRPNMAGHAEYLMHVFKPVGSHAVALGASAQRQQELRLQPAPLENTPDVSKLQNQPALRKELLDWLAQPDVLARADQGTLLLPEKYLSHAALSVAPHGMARLANRPYSQLFKAHEFGALKLAEYRTFKSSEELLRRLDGLSCTGCHQTHSMAGFHVLGEDDPTRRADTLAVSHSSHVTHELTRRSAYLAALHTGATPDDFRPPAERPTAQGNYGDTCRPSGGAWSCATGLHCVPLTEEDWGQCLPSTARAGSACEPGRMSTQADPHRDFLKLTTPDDCGAHAVCERSGVGFPGGMCAKSCAALQPGERCGSIAVLDGFNTCLARHEPFEQCIQSHARPAALRACSANEPCRDDYVCARTAAGDGACIPPYFLFQLRVDGHVIP